MELENTNLEKVCAEKIQKINAYKKTESTLNYKYSQKKILKSIIMANETQ